MEMTETVLNQKSLGGITIGGEVAKKSIQVASEICVFTNNNIKVEKI